MECPKEVQQALTKAGGKTLTGKPIYRFEWSGDFTYLISNGKSYEHFRVIAEDCWLLVKWEDAAFWGTEENWNYDNREASGLLTAGPFPRQGRYRVLQKIQKPVVEDGKAKLVPCLPELEYVYQVFPLVKDFQDLEVQKKAELLTNREKEQKDSLLKGMSASRELYRGAGTAKQIQARIEGIEKFLSDPDQVAEALKMTKRSN
jgi:hypothetical protein